MAPRKIKGEGLPRNPQRTRERILTAALGEFAAKGFAGARVDKIAARSRSNKRMIYHYFNDKAGLFRAVLRQKISERTSRVYSLAPDNLAARLSLWFEQNCQDQDWMRLLTWDSLQTTGDLMDVRERRRQVKRAVNLTRREQKAGALDQAYEPAYLVLAVTALAMFPHALPQLSRLITGRSPQDAQFQATYKKVLKRIALAFAPALKK